MNNYRVDLEIAVSVSRPGYVGKKERLAVTQKVSPEAIEAAPWFGPGKGIGYAVAESMLHLFAQQIGDIVEKKLVEARASKEADALACSAYADEMWKELGGGAGEMHMHWSQTKNHRKTDDVSASDRESRAPVDVARRRLEAVAKSTETETENG